MGFLGFVNWKSESYPVAIDFTAVPFFALFFPSVRLFLDTCVFEPLARRLIFGKESQDVVKHAQRKKINKFKESAWKYVYFLSAELLALSVSYHEPWFTDTKYFWVGPGDQIWPDQKLKLKLKALYMYVAGFYTYSIFALIFWETRRKDFVISMAHHVSTIILLVLSYMLRFARVGSIVLALHDATDGFLEIAKMSRYIGYEWIASIFFVLFVLNWTILRIIYYPFWVLRSTSYEVLLTLDMEKFMVDGPLYYYLFNTLLFIILVFNIYWWILMIRMVVEQIQAGGQVNDDVRSGICQRCRECLLSSPVVRCEMYRGKGEVPSDWFESLMLMLPSDSMTSDSCAICALCERWSDTTLTFQLPIGEYTITPSDFASLTGISCVGS